MDIIINHTVYFNKGLIQNGIYLQACAIQYFLFKINDMLHPNQC